MILTRIYGYACLVLLCACLTLFALWQHADARRMKLAASLGEAVVKHAIAVEAERRKASEDLARVRSKLPKAGRTVSDAVHQAPSDCSVSPAVGDSLRSAVRAGNAARGSDGQVPRPERAGE